MDFIPYGKQYIDKKDRRAVKEVLKSPFITQGPKVKEFEEKICEYTGAKYAVAVSNGTAALHLASLSILNPADKVLTSPNSFVATSNAILYAGAKPVFVDIKDDGNIDLDLCEEILKNDPSIKALYAVHFSGNPVEQEKLKVLKERYGIKILEDCAHSIGAEYKEIKAGSCKNSDCSILSFHPVKHLTTGEGGAITTNEKSIYEKLLLLRNHGITKDENKFLDKNMAYDEKGNLNPWYYEQQLLGFNYRITDMQCALGISQFEKLDTFIKRRRDIALKYDEEFEKEELIKPLYGYNGRSSYHLYVVRIDFEKLFITKAELFHKMREKSIGLQLHYIPINKQPYYRSLGYGKEETPKMDRYYKEALSLPMYPSLEQEEQEYVIKTLKKLVNENRK